MDVFTKADFLEETLPVCGGGSHGVVVESLLSREGTLHPVVIKLNRLRDSEGVGRHLYVAPGSDCIVQPLGLRLDEPKRYGWRYTDGEEWRFPREGSYSVAPDTVLFPVPRNREDCLCLVMEKADGSVQGPVAPEKARRLTLHLLLALDHLHRGSLIHGDVNVNNVVWFGDFPKLTDFDLMTSVWPEGNRERAPQRGYCIQIWSHRSPELLINQDFGVASDIWAAGCTAFQALFGESFLPDRLQRSPLSVIGDWIRRRFTDPEETLDRWRHTGDHEAVEVLLGMLDYDPQRRLSAVELLSKKWFRDDLGFIKQQQEKSEEFWRRDQAVGRSPFPFAFETVDRLYLRKTLMEKDAFAVIKQLLYAAAFLEEHPELGDEIDDEVSLLKTLLALHAIEYPLHQVNFCNINRRDEMKAQHLRGTRYPILHKTTAADLVIKRYKMIGEKITLKEIYDLVRAHVSPEALESEPRRFSLR